MGLEKISEYKKALNLTNEELANLSGVPKGTLDKILSGITKDPKLGTLKALAKVLNCTLDDFDDSTNIPNSKLSKDESVLLDNYTKLNQLGKNKLLEYSNDLIETPKYIENTVIPLEEAKTLQDLNPEILAAHDDDLTNEEKAEADRRILEYLKTHN